MECRPHRNAVSVAIERALAACDAGEDRGEPMQLDLFASRAEAKLFKRRRGRPPTAHGKRKSRRR